VFIIVGSEQENGLIRLPVAALPQGAYSLMARTAEGTLLATARLVKY
jgi:hypothetical protein